MILTNGGGAGVLAADELQDAGGMIGGAFASTSSKLDQRFFRPDGRTQIPSTSSATQVRSGIVPHFRNCWQMRHHDAVLVMQCPTALASSIENATVVVEIAKETSKDKANGAAACKPLLTCWLGDEAARALAIFSHSNGIPTFETPSDAIVGLYAACAARAVADGTHADARWAAHQRQCPADPCRTTVLIAGRTESGSDNSECGRGKGHPCGRGYPCRRDRSLRRPLARFATSPSH